MDILADFQNYLIDNRITSSKHAPYWAYWVKCFIDYEDDPIKLHKQITLVNFIKDLSKKDNIKDWQIYQAKSAIDAYLISNTNIDAHIKSKSHKIKEPTKTITAIRSAIRLRHYSYKTEKIYIDWIKRFNCYLVTEKNTNIEHATLTVALAKDYLEWLAVKRKVSASTQNQAFNSILFLMKNVLKVDTKGFDKTIRAKKNRKIPVVLSVEETKELLNSAQDKTKLILELLYGTGMRLSELTKLRIKDIDFDNDTIFIRSGKGDKDRTVPLPHILKKQLQAQVQQCKKIHDLDLNEGYGEVKLPLALDRKYPNARYSFSWQYLFPSHKLSVDPLSGKIMRYHISNESIQKSIKNVKSKTSILKHVTVHTLRHSFATHLLQSGVNIREIQDLLGHKNLETTMIYTHVLRNLSNTPASPLDLLYQT